MKLMSLEFPLSNQILTAVRLVTGGICAQLGFDLDETEDCKVCVTESLLLLSRRGGKNVHVTFEQDNSLRIRFDADSAGGQSDRLSEEEISVALLSALVDDLQIRTEDNLMRISFGIGKL